MHHRLCIATCPTPIQTTECKHIIFANERRVRSYVPKEFPTNFMNSKVVAETGGVEPQMPSNPCFLKERVGEGKR